MSLKTDYFDGATGLQTKCATAYTAGVTFITVTNLAAISTALLAAAAAGNTAFVVSLVTNDSPTVLRANKGDNLILKSYLAGVQKGLADQSIYNYECSAAINIVDPTVTKIDLSFDFQTT